MTTQQTLTDREAEVVYLASLGLSQKEVAERMHISTSGVKQHVTAVMNKWCARNITHVVALAMREGTIR